MIEDIQLIVMKFNAVEFYLILSQKYFKSCNSECITFNLKNLEKYYLI